MGSYQPGEVLGRLRGEQLAAAAYCLKRTARSDAEGRVAHLLLYRRIPWAIAAHFDDNGLKFHFGSDLDEERVWRGSGAGVAGAGARGLSCGGVRAGV